LRLRDEHNFPSTTAGGQLACKRILYIPWSPKTRNEVDVASAFKLFISQAFSYANMQKCKSIGSLLNELSIIQEYLFSFLAFPAIGCGGFQFDLNTIAKCMLRETKNELKTQERKMNISFILLKNQQKIYDAFVSYLNELETIDLSVSHKMPTKKIDDNQLTIPFERRSRTLCC